MKNIVITILSVFVLVLTGTTVYFMKANKEMVYLENQVNQETIKKLEGEVENLKKENNTLIQDDGIKSVKETVEKEVENKTKNWNIDENKKFGYKLKYPLDWRKVENATGTSYGPISIQEDTLFRIRIVSNIPQKGDFKKEDNREFVKKEEVIFKGSPAVKIYVKNISTSNVHVTLYIEKNGQFFAVGQPTLNDSNYPFDNSYNEDINLILSSLEFIK